MKSRPAVEAGRSTATRSWVLTSATLAVCILAALYFGARGGIEGDDLNMLFGMRHLDVVSPAGVYRYGWQPLAYDLFAGLARWGWTTRDMMALGSVLGALGFAALILAAVDLSAATAATRARVAQVAVILAVMTSELWITALYFNTTALGLPFFVIAVWLALGGRFAAIPMASAWRGAAVGAAFSIAALMRLDYATAGPLIAVLLYLNGRRAAPVLSFAAVTLATLGAYALHYPQWPELIVQILTLYRGEVFPGWSIYNSVLVFVAGFGVALLLMAVVLPAQLLKQLVWPWSKQRIVVTASLLPMLLPASHLYSGKYLVPLAASLLLMLFEAWGRLPVRTPPVEPGRARIACGWLAVAVLTVTGLVHPRDIAAAPVKAWFNSPFLVYSHDGKRMVGFFARALHDFRHETRAPEDMRAMRDLAGRASDCDSDLVIQMAAPIWFWAPVLFELDRRAWVLQQYEHDQSASFTRSGSAARLIVQRAHRPVPPNFQRLDLTQLNTFTGAELDAYVQTQRAVLAGLTCRTPSAAPLSQ